MQLTLYLVKCKKETISLSFLSFLFIFFPHALHATHGLYNWLTVQFSTVFYSTLCFIEERTSFRVCQLPWKRMAGMCWVQPYEAVSWIFACGIG